MKEVHGQGCWIQKACVLKCVCVWFIHTHTHTHNVTVRPSSLGASQDRQRTTSFSPYQNNRCNADAKNKHMLRWFFWSCCSTCMNREVCMGWSRQILRCLSLYSIVIISKPTTSGTASRIEIIQIRMISVAVQAETPAPLIWFLDTTARYLLRSMGQC